MNEKVNKGEGWKGYIEKTANIKPRENMIKALEFVNKKDNALDLGAGALADSRFLLLDGFKSVLAVDAEDIRKFEGIKYPTDPRFNLIVSSFEDFVFPKDTEFDFVSAQYSLSFIKREYFKIFLDKVIESLVVGGIFCGQIFGLETDFPGKEGRSYFTFDEAVDFFKEENIEIISFTEKNEKGLRGQNIQSFNFVVKKVS